MGRVAGSSDPCPHCDGSFDDAIHIRIGDSLVTLCGEDATTRECWELARKVPSLGSGCWTCLQRAGEAWKAVGDSTEETELLRDALLLAVIEPHRDDWVCRAEDDASLSFEHLFERNLAASSSDPSGEYSSYPTGAGNDLIVKALESIAAAQLQRMPIGTSEGVGIRQGGPVSRLLAGLPIVPPLRPTKPGPPTPPQPPRHRPVS